MKMGFPARPPPPIWVHGASVACIMGVALLCYLNALGVPFQFDDHAFIVTNAHIRDLGDIHQVMFGMQPPRPLLYISLALNYRIGGLQPFGYHLVNVGLHMLNGALVYGIALAAGRAADADRSPPITGLALCAALLFVCHPIQTEAVTYVSGRSDLLVTGFYLLSSWCFIHSAAPSPSGASLGYRIGKGGVHGLALLAFAAALGTKAIALSLPLVLLAYDYFFIARSDPKRWLRRAWVRHGPFIALALARLYLYPSAWSPSHGDSILPLRGDPVWQGRPDFLDNLLTQTHAVMAYLELLVWPVGLNADHDFPVTRSVMDPTFIVSLGVVLLLLVGSVALRRVAPVVAFGIIWFLLTLAIFFALPLPDLLVERRLYLPSVGFCLAVIFALGLLVKSLLYRWRPERIYSLAIALVVGLILACAVATIGRNQVWQDPVALWRDAAAKSPDKLRPQLNLAAASLRQGRFEAGLEAAHRALRLAPFSGMAHFNALDAYLAMGQWNAVFDHLTEALRRAPSHAVHWTRVRRRYLQPQGERLQQTLAAYASALAAGDAPGDGHMAVGLIYFAVLEDDRRAFAHLNQGLKLPFPHFNEESIRQVLEQIDAQPGWTDAVP